MLNFGGVSLPISVLVWIFPGGSPTKAAVATATAPTGAAIGFLRVSRTTFKKLRGLVGVFLVFLRQIIHENVCTHFFLFLVRFDFLMCMKNQPGGCFSCFELL